MKTTKLLAGAGLVILTLGGSSLQAASLSWTGAFDTDYSTAANWSPNGVPGAADSATISTGTVVYNASNGDLAVGSLLINGGSFTQVNGVAYMQFGGRSLTVSSGTFSMGTAGQLARNATSSFTITGGTANVNGNIINKAADFGTFSITSGVLNINGEFKPAEDFAFSGGTINSNLISFSDGPGNINLSGGNFSVNGSVAYNGIYGGGVQGINFLTGATGSFYFSNISLADLTTTGYLTNGTFKYNGVNNTGELSAVDFNGGVLITAAVPEPSTFALLGAGLVSLVALKRRSRKQ